MGSDLIMESTDKSNCHQTIKEHPIPCRQQLQQQIPSMTNKEADCLLKLKEMIREEKSLKGCCFKDEFLLRFVRSKKCRAKLSLDTLKNYVAVRREKYPTFFANFCPSSVRHVYESGMVRVLKNRDAYGRQVFVFRTDKWDPEVADLDDILKVFLLYCEEMLNSEETQRAGLVLIRDYESFGLSHMRICPPGQIRKACNMFVNSFPSRYKAAHVIRNSYLFHILFAMAKPFLSQKLKSRFLVHGYDLDSLHSHVSPEILPDWLGGKLDDAEAFDTKLEELVFKCENYRSSLNF
ncbi:unnamed protein product [Orchesella dallaii]|uniref:CRAL-TRIO domain-containing protein n=1 Tax=Orchesella dallaii TaxID=48710 RepID=A0ABP1R5H2_9HEXA